MPVLLSRRLIAAGALMLCALYAAPWTAASAAEPAGAVQQLRIYEIFEHNKAAFHDRFRDHAVRIMQRHGFDIAAMWETQHEGRTEFVYLLNWPDEATLEAGWESFMADAEWAEIKRLTAAEHGRLVGEIESRTLRRTAYSPTD